MVKKISKIGAIPFTQTNEHRKRSGSGDATRVMKIEDDPVPLEEQIKLNRHFVKMMKRQYLFRVKRTPSVATISEFIFLSSNNQA